VVKKLPAAPKPNGSRWCHAVTAHLRLGFTCPDWAGLLIKCETPVKMWNTVPCVKEVTVHQHVTVPPRSTSKWMVLRWTSCWRCFCLRVTWCPVYLPGLIEGVITNV